MKYLVMLCDGAADRPLGALGGKTPLDAAKTPMMDMLARSGACGMARTVPAGMPPGSDTANMSVMGFDPRKYYSGRSPLEAMSMGIDLKEDDVAIRCNLSSISETGSYEDAVMEDFSSGEIDTEEAVELVRFLADNLNESDMRLYPGISFRHCLVLNHAETGTTLTPPHDISGKPIKDHLPAGRYGERLLELQKRSFELLREHPINVSRKKRGEPPANTCWLWGEGTRPKLPAFKALYGVDAGVACAVDLIKGLALCSGMKAPAIPGATGGKRTDCAAKGRAAIRLFDGGCDLVYIHVEAPDESAHAGDLPCKLEALESIDRDILSPVLAYLRSKGDFRVLLAPDHPTPIALRTHTGDPVPFVLYDSARETKPHADGYSEAAAERTGLCIDEGYTLMGKLINGDF